MNILNPGSLDIKKFKLLHKNGDVDLVGYVTQLDIFESVISPSIHADMAVYDGAGLIDRVDLAGSEVEIEFTSYETSNAPKFKFVIQSVDNIQVGPNSSYKTYTVRMSSPELFSAAAQTTTEIFKDKQPEDMITAILQNALKTQKKFNYEKTLGIDTVNVTKLKPFQAIDKIRRRSVSRTNKSSSYCFFENRFGYNFSTIEHLISEGKKDPTVVNGDRNFTFETVSKVGVENTDWRNILAAKQVKNQNLLETLAIGGVQNVVWAFNLETGTTEPYRFEKTKDDGQFNIDQESFTLRKDIASKYQGDEMNATNTIIPIRNERDLERVKKENFITPYLSRLLSNILNIEIWGDSALTAGSVINIEFPVSDGMTDKSKNKMISGNYLITQLRHIIRPTGQGNYTQACEVLKTGFLKE